ncbi:hypothetical protein FZI85_14280 [Mycobacterium sp. CBMA293]|uniref:hypothetical protein n=1 Tax=unclassified Mycolicibacterium TaxID=2636767 RepID=UPI0012DC5966|nr:MULTISPECIES: hypothetical protein [unclassified Mycolicibacterium]MUL48190.1 hypothetical protein [Mycolicibacterium sp. CBMA 360]MUL57641.1 hypothetical protein [Mycolicibacterium sp. CBMA 335]MUL70681.1 hypothetical protein [Mycolicibacterium sp. CBMA 311]MUL92729.1 hypothetical protein [Mycolicibacterium sp. CBMA 230]MUM08256.1 hypothetical protein [Mycolicibacterium sp. CBMA 213]
MRSPRLVHRITAAVGGTALIAMVGLTAGCGEEKKAPETPSSTTTTTTTTTPSSTAPVAPTEKSIDPNGGNLFTPQVTANPAPTAVPGTHRN